MDEQHPAPHLGESFTPSNVTSFAVKVVIESMKGSKNDRIRRYGENAGDVPKALARYGSRAIDAIFGSSENPSEEVLAEAAKDLAQHPEAVVAAAGQILISTVADVQNSSTQLRNDLDGYATVMNYICEFMRNSRSSIVLLGFFQGDDCASYWHLTGEPKISIDGARIRWSGFQLYLKWSETLADDIVKLNEMIRDSDELRLPGNLYDFRKDPNTGEVSEVRRSEVTVRKLDPDAPRHPLFGKDDTPKSFNYHIPVDVPGALTMFQSFKIAKDILNARSVGFANTLAAINELASKPEPIT
jgi:hypothetical protein